MVNYTLTITLLMNTIFHSHSLKSSHHCSCCTIYCGRSIVYHWYLSRPAIEEKTTRATSKFQVPGYCSTLGLSLSLSLEAPTTVQPSFLFCCVNVYAHEQKLVLISTTLLFYWAIVSNPKLFWDLSNNQRLCEYI